MPFYIRKSFSFGPMRLNLSKSGLGVSAGVKGLRVGVNARGKKYLQAGRSGLYYRQSLEGNQSTAPRPAIQRPSGRGVKSILWIIIVIAAMIISQLADK